MNKRICAMLLALVMTASLAPSAFAAPSALPTVDKSQMTAKAISAVGEVYVNNEILTGNESMGYFWVDSNGRTQAPVRLLVEKMGYSISYNKGVVTVPSGPNGDLKVAIGSNQYTVGSTKKTMDTVAAMIDGRTYVPLRFVAEALGAKVDAQGSDKGLIIKITFDTNTKSTINGVADIMLEDCKNVKTIIEKYPDICYTPVTGLVRMSYLDTDNTELILDIRHGVNSYEISGLDFGDGAKRQYELVYALIDDVVEENSRQALKDELQKFSDITSKGYSPENGATAEALEYSRKIDGKTFRIGNVNYTWKLTGGIFFNFSKAS